jgi:hypothetical protein
MHGNTCIVCRQKPQRPVTAVQVQQPTRRSYILIQIQETNLHLEICFISNRIWEGSTKSTNHMMVLASYFLGRIGAEFRLRSIFLFSESASYTYCLGVFLRQPDTTHTVFQAYLPRLSSWRMVLLGTRKHV